MIYLIIILVAGVLLFMVVSAGSQNLPAKSAPAKSRVDKAEIGRRWKTIQMVSRTGASGLRNSVMEADKLLDYVMKQMGYPGETMADRLKVAQRGFSDRDGVWRAHKLRNAMAHDIEFDLVSSQAQEAINDIGRALKDLEVI